MARLRRPIQAAELDTAHESDLPPRRSTIVPREPARADRIHQDDPFEILSREIVSEVLTYFGRVKAAVTVAQGARTSAGSLALAAGDAGDLGLTIEAGTFSTGPATVRLSAHGVEFRIEGALASAGHDAWLLSNVRLFSLDQRAAERLDLATGVATLRWNEVQDGCLVAGAAPVEELSTEGVSFTAVRGASSVPAHSPFAATLEIDGKRFDCLAEMRHVQGTDEQMHCGVKLHPGSRRADLIDAYLHHRFPELHRRRDVDPDRVYGLLDRSGYLGLRSDMRPPRDWFARSDDDAISRDVCFRARDGELIGHVSFTRAYPRAWLGHQLATIRNHAEATACRRAIYLHIATYPTLIDGDDAMMVGYYDRGRPWHQRFFTGFVDWLRNPNLAIAYSLDRFERSSLEAAPLASFAAADVGAPRPDELAPAAALIRAHLPPLVASALDIHPGGLVADALNEDYRTTRYERGRHALVLRVAGGVAGVALCEVGSRELSIFNLFNMAQLFVLPTTPVGAQLALLGAVRAFYAARGERNPMIVAPPGTLAASREPGTVLAETMGMIAWSGRALRQYENFIKYQFGRQLELVA